MKNYDAELKAFYELMAKWQIAMPDEKPLVK